MTDARSHSPKWDENERHFWAAFGRMVSLARRSKSITQQELADQLGMTRSKVGMIEVGKQGVHAFDFAKISYVLAVDLEAVLAEVALPPIELRRLSLANARLREAESNVRIMVYEAREAGHSWALIGDAVGISRQSAWERYSKGDDDD